MEDFLKPLDQIKQVEAPAFLFTRIQQKIKNEFENRFSRRAAFSLVTSFVLLILINGLVLRVNQHTNGPKSNVVESFQLLPNNNIYK